MAWSSKFYGDPDQIRDTVLRWAEKNRFPVDRFEVEPARIGASEDEPIDGATIIIRTSINRRMLENLQHAIERVPGCKPRVWRPDCPSEHSL